MRPRSLLVPPIGPTRSSCRRRWRALQVLPVMLGVRGAVDRAVRHTARARSGRLALAALQPMEPRRGRQARGPAAVPAVTADRSAHACSLAPTSSSRSESSFFSRSLSFPQQPRGAVGLVDRAADHLRPRGPAAADRQAVRLDAEDAGAGARDEGHPGQVQGEDKERQNQEMMKFYRENGVATRLGPRLPCPAAAGVHLAVLHVAREPADRHLPADPAGRPEVNDKWVASASRTRWRGGPQTAVDFLFIGDLTNKASARRWWC